MGKEAGYSKDKEVARLHNIRKAIDALAANVKRGDTNAMERSAHLASSAGKISARIGLYNDAGDYYKHGGDMLRLARGAGAEEQKEFMDALYNKSDRMYRINDKVKRGRGKVLEEHAEEVAVGKYEKAHAMALIAALFAGSIALMTLTATGRVVGYAAQKSSSLLGICLFAICIVAAYVILIRKKD